MAPRVSTWAEQLRYAVFRRRPGQGGMRPGLRFIGFPLVEEKKRFRRFDVEPEGVDPEIREHTNLLAIPRWTALYDLEGNRIDVTKRKYVATDLPKARHILQRVAKGDEQ